MLAQLKIENVAVIEKAEISFENGFSVLTGETGAGKSIIIDSINAVLGERTSKELVRTGAAQARVSALFYSPTSQVTEKLEELGVESEADGSIVIQRVISFDGRSICRVNGSTVTVSMLRSLGRLLINIHGQHDSQALLDSCAHCAYLDLLAQNGGLLNAYRAEYEKVRATRKRIAELSENEEERQRKLDYIRFQIDELTAAQLTPGETEQLQEQKKRYLDSERIQQLLHSVHDALDGCDGYEGASDLLYTASEGLDSLKKYYSELSDAAEATREYIYSIREYSQLLSELLSDFEYNTIDIDYVESRLDVLWRLSKKYGATEDEMLERLGKLQAEYESLQCSDEELAQLSSLLQQQEELMMKAGEKLTLSRREAATDFSVQVMRHLGQLDMPGVVLKVERTEIPPSPDGLDSVCFLISPNPGEVPKPLSKIASGGELSRIMLAFKSVFAGRDSISTMIFDEIDTGVSGSAAGKMARKLRALSRGGRQVICVTHLARLAAYADSHYYIDKTTDGVSTKTRVTLLNREQRITEIARIIGGEAVSEAARINAEEMLSLACDDKSE